MRNEVSRSGGVNSREENAPTAIAARVHTGAACGIAATIAAGATAEPFSALTNCCSACVWQSDLVVFECGQQPCFCCASSTCGHEKQFPRNRAAITNTAMIEVRTARMVNPSITGL